jgi:polyhydroxyalkanoate synthesis regulator phasin
MDELLISKKELLDLTGISYGQLYRWKRKNLIPEDWFIKKSSFTGQETFFPKDRIMSRINKIMNMKDDLSLNDIADMVSPAPVNVSFSKEDLIERRIISEYVFNIYLEQNYSETQFSFDNVLILFVLEKLLSSGDINIDEGKTALQELMENYQKLEGKPAELYVMRKLGVSSIMLAEASARFYLDRNVKIAARINLSSCIEELKTKIA